MKPTIEQVKEVRERTGLSLSEITKAFAQVENFESIYTFLKFRGHEILEKKRERTAGVITLDSYVHGGKYGAMVSFNCETDFVARSDAFKQFMHGICMHVAATPLPHQGEQELAQCPGFASLFLEQPYVVDPSKTLADVVAEISAKTGEKVEVGIVQRHVVK